MGDTKDVAREALASAKFVQLLEFDKEDPTLVYVQPVDKGYWYKSWRSEMAAADRAWIHIAGEGRPFEYLERLGIESVSYTNLTLGLCVYAYINGEVVKAEIVDIKSQLTIVCTELTTRSRFTTTDTNIFLLPCDKQKGMEEFYDNKATKIRLSKLSLISGLEDIHKLFAEANFKDWIVWELKVLERDVPSAKFPLCDLISMKGVSLSDGLLSTMRDKRMCGVKLILNKISVIAFTHVDPDGTYVCVRADEDWVFDRIRIGIEYVEEMLEKNPVLIHHLKRDIKEKHINTPGYIFLARYMDNRLYRVGILGLADDEGQNVVVELIDYGFQFIVSLDDLLNASEVEPSLNYILPRCVKAKVIDDNGAPIVGDKLFDLVGGDNSIENLIKRLESCQLREVLVTAKEEIDNVEVFTIQTAENNSLFSFGVYSHPCQQSERPISFYEFESKIHELI